MKVALVICPQSNPDKPPLALAYLGAYLRERNIEVACFDFNIDLYSRTNNEKKNLWNSVMDVAWTEKHRYDLINLVDDVVIQGWVEQIEQAAPQIIGFSLLSTNMLSTLKLARKLRERSNKVKIIFGGPEVYKVYGCAYQQIFSCADALVFGEGEESLFQIISSIMNSGRIEPRSGIMVKKCDVFLGSDTPTLIGDVDNINFPAYDWFPLNKYKEKGAQLPLIFSRGCIGKCNFCFERAYWRKFRCRSVNNVIAEIKQIREKYGVWCFALNDSLINGNMQFLSEFCDRVIDEDIKISWWGMARINSQMTEQFLAKMVKAGCVQLAYGIESGSQKVLDAMRKGYDIHIIDQVLRNTYQVGIKLGVSLMLGFPGEEEDDFQLTCELVKRNGQYLSYTNISTLGIEPFTDIFNERIRKRINIKNIFNWLTDMSIFNLNIRSFTNLYKDRIKKDIDFKNCINWQTLDRRNNPLTRTDRARRLSKVVNQYVGKAITFTSKA
ncbi:B12-binding domain-containing radical SAM protein [Candidatus Omnitrophota bacterium]